MYISPTNPGIPRIFYSGIYKKWTVNVYRWRLGGKYSLWVKAYNHALKLNDSLLPPATCPQDSGEASLPTTPSRTLSHALLTDPLMQNLLSPELAEHVEHDVATTGVYNNESY